MIHPPDRALVDSRRRERDAAAERLRRAFSAGSKSGGEVLSGVRRTAPVTALRKTIGRHPIGVMALTAGAVALATGLSRRLPMRKAGAFVAGLLFRYYVPKVVEQLVSDNGMNGAVRGPEPLRDEKTGEQ